ncbi:hypothetical protein RA2_04030 [Roseovarius sp. A-2]|nr:hypothetical protein RA2_04030 [Roseovarius sp. A-2]
MQRLWRVLYPSQVIQNSTRCAPYQIARPRDGPAIARHLRCVSRGVRQRQLQADCVDKLPRLKVVSKFQNLAPLKGALENRIFKTRRWRKEIPSIWPVWFGRRVSQQNGPHLTPFHDTLVRKERAGTPADACGVGWVSNPPRQSSAAKGEQVLGKLHQTPVVRHMVKHRRANRTTANLGTRDHHRIRNLPTIGDNHVERRQDPLGYPRLAI